MLESLRLSFVTTMDQRLLSAFIFNTEQEHGHFSSWTVGKHTHSV